MQYLILLLNLATVASAIEIRFYNGGNCDGGWLGCQNIGPDNCCTSEAVHHPTVGCLAIPKQWNFGTRGYINGGCRDLRAQENLFNVDFGCLRGKCWTPFYYRSPNPSKIQGRCGDGKSF